mgnify:CR=1 FL=1
MDSYFTKFATLLISSVSPSTLIGYATWAESLDVSSTTSTGNVDVAFGMAKSNDPPGTIDSGYDRDIATTKVEGAYTKELIVSLDNAYPCYESEIEFTVRNTGSIPARIKSDIDAPDEIDVEVTGLGVGEVIKTWKKGYLHVHISENALESKDYIFSVNITATQWNK